MARQAGAGAVKGPLLGPVPNAWKAWNRVGLPDAVRTLAGHRAMDGPYGRRSAKKLQGEVSGLASQNRRIRLSCLA